MLILSEPEDRGQINLTHSTVTNPLTIEPEVLIVPRGQVNEEDMTRPIHWSWYFQIDGALNKRPSFRWLADAQEFGTEFWYWHGELVNDGWAPVYTYDHVTWYAFPPAVLAGPEMHFQASEAFIQDRVWIGYHPIRRYQDEVAMIQAIKTNPYVRQTRSSRGDFIIGVVDATVREDGKPIPALPIYAFRISDWSADPLDGTRKRQCVLTSGVHPAEDPARFTLQAAVNFLLSEDPKAVALRRDWEFIIYPTCNPAGVYGGHWRGCFQQGYSLANSNRHWGMSSPLNTVTKHVAAFLRDTPHFQVDFAIDFHTGPFGSEELFMEIDARQGFYQEQVNTYVPIPVTHRSFISGSTWGFFRSYGVPFGLTVEQGAKAQSVERCTTYGQALMRGIYDCYAAGLFPKQMKSSPALTLIS